MQVLGQGKDASRFKVLCQKLSIACGHSHEEWHEKDWCMGYEHLVGDIELKYLVVKLETRIKNSKLLAKNF